MAKVKIPKRVAGVKVPGKVRKQAKKALKLTDSRAVRDLALAGLTLAAETMIERVRASGSTGGGASRPARASLAALDLGEVVRAAVTEGARRFLEGFEEVAVAAAPPAKPAPAAPAAPKPKRSRATGSAAKPGAAGRRAAAPGSPRSGAAR